VTDILPAVQQKRQNYETKFKLGNPQNFWHHDEMGIVSCLLVMILHACILLTGTTAS